MKILQRLFEILEKTVLFELKLHVTSLGPLKL